MRGFEQARYQAQRSFKRRIGEKETQNPAIIAKVGNGAGTVVVPGRPGWIYIRLHGDDNQLAEAKLGIPLNTAELNDAWVKVRRASPRQASYYVLEQFITSSGGDPTPPPSGWMWHSFIFTAEEELTEGAKLLRIYIPGVFTIDKVYISVDTPPTGAAIIVDVNKNGVSIFTNQANRPQIAAGNNTGESGTPDVTALVLNDCLTFDIDQIGSTEPGANLTVHVRCKQYLSV
jgi:hypothetical protein